MVRQQRVIPRRASGVLLPVFSIPNHLDQGDFGPGAIRWLDWLAVAQQRYWMILPLGPVDSTGSPYASDSAFALNPLLISPEKLSDRGLITAALRTLRPSLDRRAAARRRTALLRVAWKRWLHTASSNERRRFAQFQSQSRSWLPDYAQFSAWKHRYGQRPWWNWPRVHQRPRKKIADPRLEREMEFVAFCQWLAAEQWADIRRAARARRIEIIGDMPFAVRHDSADAWAKPKLFFLRGSQTALVTGMPADQFARFGQRWGTPVFRWSAHRAQKFAWWTARIEAELRRADVVRLDHFQGFIREWAIPARRHDGRVGRWLPASGAALWSIAQQRFRVRAIAEDLGLPLPAADQLRQKLGFPGIRLFPFSWSGWPRNIHALEAIRPDVVYMTSNHDLPSIREWYQSVAKSYERQHLRARIGTQALTPAAIRVVLGSAAQLAIIAAADVFNLGRGARINTPGQRRGNWRWRLSARLLTRATARGLANMTAASGRAVDVSSRGRYTQS